MSAPPAGGLRLALSMFTIAPVSVTAEIDRRTAARALLWLPVVGAGLGALAAVPLVVLSQRAGLLGAVLTVLLLALLTRGLHLDGLADLIDGLGCRQPAEQALSIMRRSDIGAFGVAALMIKLLLDVAALATLAGYCSRWQLLVVLAVAATAGRVAVLWAAGRGIAPARPGGFGSLVAGSVGRGAQLTASAGLLGLAVLAQPASDSAGWTVTVALVTAILLGLLLAGLVCGHAVRRLGGVTGDVFGALVEITTTAVLVLSAIGSTWA